MGDVALVLASASPRRAELLARLGLEPEVLAAEVDWYVGTGEPRDKAGAYAVQGLGAVLVERIDGDPTTVIGLPLRLTVERLRAAGLRWP